jgi:hypothetical protein
MDHAVNQTNCTEVNFLDDEQKLPDIVTKCYNHLTSNENFILPAILIGCCFVS